MIGIMASKAGRKADVPIDVGSTIPRTIRMGTKATLPLASDVPAAAVDTRTGRRFVPHRNKTFLTLATGKKIDARIINISSLGVAVEADLRTTPSVVTMVGARPVKPGRRIALGAVFLFVKPIPEAVCTENLVL